MNPTRWITYGILAVVMALIAGEVWMFHEGGVPPKHTVGWRP